MTFSQKITVLTLTVIVGMVAVEALTPRAADPVITQLEAERAGLRSIIKAEEAQLQIVRETNDSLSRLADRADLRYAARPTLRSHFAIDSVAASPVPAVTLTASRDTTQMFDLVRLTDSSHFSVPLEFVVTARQELAAADSAFQAEHKTRLYQQNYVIPLKDTLITQLHLLADYNAREAALWKAKANPRCGRRCVMALSIGGTLAVISVARRYGP